MLARADALFDSNTVAHASRWTLDLPDTKLLRTYCQNVLDQIIEKLHQENDHDAALYPYRLAWAHEAMHSEACFYTLQTLGIAPPSILNHPEHTLPLAHEIHFTGGEMQLGKQAQSGFVFDNENCAHTVVVPPFSMDATLISNQQYSEFIDAGGYESQHYWNDAGRTWLVQNSYTAPRYWQRSGQYWQCLRFGEVLELTSHAAGRHITVHEARAYCAWAGRRLPGEAEWEFAAKSNHADFYWGDLWEWTDSTFAPYPGFSADAYQEYSAPWFHTHQVLRGASFATQRNLISPAYRNFYTPDRNDIFTGFRTCAV